MSVPSCHRLNAPSVHTWPTTTQVDGKPVADDAPLPTAARSAPAHRPAVPSALQRGRAALAPARDSMPAALQQQQKVPSRATPPRASPRGTTPSHVGGGKGPCQGFKSPLVGSPSGSPLPPTQELPASVVKRSALAEVHGGALHGDGRRMPTHTPTMRHRCHPTSCVPRAWLQYRYDRAPNMCLCACVSLCATALLLHRALCGRRLPSARGRVPPPRLLLGCVSCASTATANSGACSQ